MRKFLLVFPFVCSASVAIAQDGSVAVVVASSSAVQSLIENSDTKFVAGSAVRPRYTDKPGDDPASQAIKATDAASQLCNSKLNDLNLLGKAAPCEVVGQELNLLSHECYAVTAKRQNGSAELSFFEAVGSGAEIASDGAYEACRNTVGFVGTDDTNGFMYADSECYRVTVRCAE